MDASIFRLYIRDIILPLYPNISKDCIMENGKVIQGLVFLKTDSGPGRFKEDMEHILFLEHMNSIGLNIILSLPNGTSVHAELDQFFGSYKGYCRTRTLNHFAEKLGDKIRLIEENKKIQMTRNEALHVNGLKNLEKEFCNVRKDPERGDQHEDATKEFTKVKCVVGLTNADLSVMINGKEDDEIENKPFDRCFIKSKILDAFYKVGFVPFTRKCLSNPKVRHELDEGTSKSGELEKIQENYNKHRKEVEKLGFNNVFDAKLPKKKKPKMKSSVKERVQDLINKNKAFTCSGLFMYMGTMICNSKEVITAQKELMRRSEVIKKKL